jgi:hypothetical protein
MEIKIETVDRILRYLGTRVWAEVEMLMHEIQNQIPQPGATPPAVIPGAKVESKIPSGKNNDRKN